tara:strand:+ start:968 stop:1177 length:210 start_codon:yes stop_codon:yes gene_type:complete
MKKPLLAFILLACITLLSSCQQQNDVGRYVPFLDRGALLDTKTGILYKPVNGEWTEARPPVKQKRPDQP